MLQTLYNDTYLFTDIFPNFEEFKRQYELQPSKMQVLRNSENLEVIYTLLYSNYGNSHFKSYNRGLIIGKTFSIIYMKGSLWEKKLEIQEELYKMDLSSPELRLGTKAIYNMAINDAGVPSTATLTEIETINKQNTTNYIKNKYDALEDLYSSLRNEATSAFIKSFDVLFANCFVPLNYNVW